MRGFLVGSLALAAVAGVSLVLLGGGVNDASGNERPMAAHAVLKDADGRTVGTAQLREGPHGVVVALEFEGAPAGTRAFHVHDTGRCEGPGFESAGEHFAPHGHEHGFLNERGPHAGDLPNLHIPADGGLSAELFLGGVTLRPGPQSLLDGDGTALVLHEGADDYISDPSGEAGDRVACGVIGR
jgi:superoxide dismutase, Cu-Zn family